MGCKLKPGFTGIHRFSTWSSEPLTSWHHDIHEVDGIILARPASKNHAAKIKLQHHLPDISIAPKIFAPDKPTLSLPQNGPRRCVLLTPFRVPHKISAISNPKIYGQRDPKCVFVRPFTICIFFEKHLFPDSKSTGNRKVSISGACNLDSCCNCCIKVWSPENSCCDVNDRLSDQDGHSANHWVTVVRHGTTKRRNASHAAHGLISGQNWIKSLKSQSSQFIWILRTYPSDITCGQEARSTWNHPTCGGSV